MKKLLSILTAAGMLLSMTVPAMAEAEKLEPRGYNPEASFYVTGEAKAAEELESGEVKWDRISMVGCRCFLGQ